MTEPRYLSPRLLQSIGVLLLIASFAYWAATGNQSPLFVGAALTLISLGSYQGIRTAVREWATDRGSEPERKDPS